MLRNFLGSLKLQLFLVKQIEKALQRKRQPKIQIFGETNSTDISKFTVEFEQKKKLHSRSQHKPSLKQYGLLKKRKKKLK